METFPVGRASLQRHAKAFTGNVSPRTACHAFWLSLAIDVGSIELMALVSLVLETPSKLYA